MAQSSGGLKQEEHSQHGLNQEQHGEMAKEYEDPEKTVEVSYPLCNSQSSRKNVLSYCCNNVLNCLFLIRWVN